MDATRWGCRLPRGEIRFKLQVGTRVRVAHLLAHARSIRSGPGSWCWNRGSGTCSTSDPTSRSNGSCRGRKAWAAYYEKTVEKAVKVLSATGAHVIMPTIPFVEGVTAGAGGNTRSSTDPARVRAANSVLTRVAARHRDELTVPDLNHFLSPRGVYQPNHGRVNPVRFDGVHYTAAGSDLVGRWLAPTHRAAPLGRRDPPAPPVRTDPRAPGWRLVNGELPGCNGGEARGQGIRGDESRGRRRQPARRGGVRRRHRTRAGRPDGS